LAKTVASRGNVVISFSGCEEDIYGLAGPHLVDGVHGRLIQQALRPEEQVRHFLLCPIWDSRSRPFGIQAPRASHALCLTDSRLVIARIYPEKDRRAPETWSINRHALIGFEFGQALLMSWLVLHTLRQGTIVRETFYFPRHGNELVAALLHSWRASWPAFGPEQTGPALSADGVVQSAGPFHARLLKPILRADEVCLRACQRPPLWGSKWTWLGRRSVALAHWGTVLLSDRSLFYVRGEPPQGKDGYVFAHNISCFSTAQLSRVDCRRDRIASVDCVRLAVIFAAAAEVEVEILFPEKDAETAGQWAQEMVGLLRRAA
jgi:hypothetical protein